MIIVKLQGGLGNQMFQYAAARSLINEREKVFVDLCFLSQNNLSTSDFTARSYELRIFRNCRIMHLSKITKRIFFSNKFIIRILRKVIWGTIYYIKQKENEYITIPGNHKNVYLDGYFQSEKYFFHLSRG